MTYRATFLINAGQYQHIELTIEDGTLAGFWSKVNAFDDGMKQALGVFHTETESHIKVTRQQLLDGEHNKSIEELVEGLGATVVSTEPVPDAPAWSKKVEPQAKPWDDSDDDFEDF